MKVIPTIKNIYSRLLKRKEYIPPRYLHKTHKEPKNIFRGDRYAWCGGYDAHKKWLRELPLHRGHWWGYESELVGESKEDVMLDRRFRKIEKKRR